MSCNVRVIVDLVIVATIKSLVTEKVDRFEAFLLYMTKTIRLIPTRWEYVKRDLATNRVCKSKVRESCLEVLYKLLPKTSFQIILFKLVTFLAGAVSTNRRYIDHTIAEFNECTPKQRIT